MKTRIGLAVVFYLVVLWGLLWGVTVVIYPMPEGAIGCRDMVHGHCMIDTDYDQVEGE